MGVGGRGGGHFPSLPDTSYGPGLGTHSHLPITLEYKKMIQNALNTDKKLQYFKPSMQNVVDVQG